MKTFRVTRPEQYKPGSLGHDNYKSRQGHYVQEENAKEAFLFSCSIHPDNCFDIQEGPEYGEPMRFCCDEETAEVAAKDREIAIRKAYEWFAFVKRILQDHAYNIEEYRQCFQNEIEGRRPKSFNGPSGQIRHAMRQLEQIRFDFSTAAQVAINVVKYVG